MPTTKQVQIIDKKEFAIAVLDPTKVVFVVHMTYLGSKILIYLARKALEDLLVAEIVVIVIEYSDYVDVFLEESATELLKCFNID